MLKIINTTIVVILLSIFIGLLPFIQTDKQEETLFEDNNIILINFNDILGSTYKVPLYKKIVSYINPYTFYYTYHEEDNVLPYESYKVFYDEHLIEGKLVAKAIFFGSENSSKIEHVIFKNNIKNIINKLNDTNLTFYATENSYHVSDIQEKISQYSPSDFYSNEIGFIININKEYAQVITLTNNTYLIEIKKQKDITVLKVNQDKTLNETLFK